MPPALALLTTLSAHLTTGMSILVGSQQKESQQMSLALQAIYLHLAIQLKSTNTFGRIVLKTL